MCRIGTSRVSCLGNLYTQHPLFAFLRKQQPIRLGSSFYICEPSDWELLRVAFNRCVKQPSRGIPRIFNISHLSESSVPHTTPSGMPIDGSLVCFTSQGIFSFGYAPSYQHDSQLSTHLRYGAFDSPMRCKAAVEALSILGFTPHLVPFSNKTPFGAHGTPSPCLVHLAMNLTLDDSLPVRILVKLGSSPLSGKGQSPLSKFYNQLYNICPYV